MLFYQTGAESPTSLSTVPRQQAIHLHCSCIRKSSQSAVELIGNRRKMWKSVRMMWLRFFNQPEAAHPVRATLRDKAVAVAGRVSVVKAGESWKGSCPVCFEAICGSNESDMRLTLALHLSLWHHNDVQSHWEIMQKKKEHLHLPSIVAGIGISVVLVTLLAFSSKKQNAASIVNGRQPVFKSS